MKTDSREMDRFTGPMFRRGLLPALISSVGLGISDVADAVVLGQRMGETGLAAISLALPVFMVINLVMHSFGSGGSIRYSRLLGEGNPKEAVKSFSFVIETALILGIVMALAGDFLIHPILSILGASRENIQLYEASRIYVEVIISGIPLFFGSYILNYYLRSDGCQKLASFGFTVGNLSDLFLNILLVLVFDLGAAGAAWSTLTGQAVAICIYLWSLRRGEREGLLAFRPAFPRLKEIYTCFRLGLSTSSQYVFQMVFLLIANRMLMKMGGENGVAVFDLVQNTSFLILYLYDGVSKTAQPLISTFVGECNSQGLKKTLRLGYGWGLGVGGLGALFVFCFPGVLCMIFGLQSPEAEELGCYALRVLAMGSLIAGICILTENFCQAGEDERGAFCIAALRGAICLIPCALQNDNIRPLTSGIEEFLERWEAAPNQQYFVAMAAEEICLSIMQKGFGQESLGKSPEEKDRAGYIQVTLVALEDGDFELHIRDDAVKFNPFSMKTAKADLDGDWDPDAIGILVIKEKSKDFFYRRYQGFNTMVIRI